MDIPRKKLERYIQIKAEIRGPFVAPDFVWKEAMKIKYKYMNNDEIFENISKLLLI